MAKGISKLRSIPRESGVKPPHSKALWAKMRRTDFTVPRRRFLPALVLLAIGAALSHSALSSPAPDRPWNEDVLYFVMTDRFHDGDPENNVPDDSDPALYDRTQTEISQYHGGDFRGLELALQDGYFNDLGITAIWITPPVANVWSSHVDSDGTPKTGYHGYWAQDFLDIDPHLVSRRSLDGTREYPDTREGRMQHYQDFVALAHRRGIKIIQDIVVNHAGPVFYYDFNGNGRLDLDRKRESIAPFNGEGSYDNARWSDIPPWNQRRTEPAETLTVLGREVKTSGTLAELSSYGRRGMSGDSLGKSDGEEVACDFFSLRDFQTAPDSGHFDRLVDDFVEIYAFYVEEIGIDGFRIDTVKHVHHAFWDAFTERLRDRVDPEKAKRLLLFGEIYDGNPVKLGQYTYRSDWPDQRGPCLDSVLNFQFCGAARSYLRRGDKPFGTGRDLEKALSALAPGAPPGAERPIYNHTPGRDGLDSARKIVNFTENHDGLNRFRVRGISERRNLLANVLTMTMPGIPCLYYGTEAALQDTRAKIDADTETGRLTYVRAGDSSEFSDVRNRASYQGIAALAAMRRELPALTGGTGVALWVDSDARESDDGVFAFARIGEGLDPVIVVLNASDKPRATGDPMRLVDAAGEPILAPGDRLERIPFLGPDSDETGPAVQWNSEGVPEVTLRIGPETAHLYRVVRDERDRE
jgi:glycosidase